MNDNLEIRIFISYSTDDRKLIDIIDRVLKANGLIPMWARDFIPGIGFHQQIKDYISHAHIFMPVITEASSVRGWVHQEIGYAMALNIPVFPVTPETNEKGETIKPGQMIQYIQAARIPLDEEKLKSMLARKKFEELLNNSMSPGNALFQLAELGEDRAVMMKQYADKVINLGFHGEVRQRGGISSFHIPDRTLNDNIWMERYLPETQTEYHCRCQRDERISLQRHADKKGCRLIINPQYVLVKKHPISKIVRLKVLVEFLENKSDSEVIIAIDSKMAITESVTIVGNWFLAESVAKKEKGSFRNTIFTRYAPIINERIRDFDLELKELLEDKGWKPEESRLNVIDILKKEIKNLEDKI